MSEKDLILAQEVARYIHDPLGFVLAMFDWDSPELKPFGGPDTWQIDFMNELSDNIRNRAFDGAISVPPIRMGRSSGHGIGKGHPLDMPFQQGYWGDLKPGDLIHVPNGSIYPILATKKYRQEHFKVTFDDGSSTVVSKEHEWLVRGRQERRKNLLTWRKLETQEIINLGVKRPNGNSMARQWELPLTEPVTYSENAPSVDAYTYGVWLGDGDKRAGRVTNIDPEVWDNLPYDTNVSGKTRTLLGLKSDLVSEGLFGCTTYNASVDPRYLRSNQRLNVLQGLLDTDGWVEQCGSAAFCSASRQLVKDVVWMARSLGLKAREEKYKPNDKAGAWTTHITWDGVTQLFRIERKQSRLIKAEHRYQCRWIDSIESVGEMDGMCIEVPGGIYLANDFIPTHNSALVAWVILFIMSTRPYAKGVVTANTSEQLKTKTWAELGKWHKKCLTADWFDFFSSRGNLALVSKRFPSEWRVDAQTCREENSESFAGLHAANSTPFYIFDEACHDDETEVLSDRGWLYFSDVTPDDSLLTMNPDTQESYFDKPSHIHVSQYEGDMILVESRAANFCVTPNHRMLFYSRKVPGASKFCEAKDMVWSNKRIPRTISDWIGNYESHFTIPGTVTRRKNYCDRQVNTEDWCEFYGWFVTEGHTQHNKWKTKSGVNTTPSTVVITQHKKLYLEEIEDLVYRMGFSYSVTDKAVFIYDPSLCAYLESHGKGFDKKRVPNFIKNLPVDCLNIFLDTVVKGDGYTRENRDIIYTSSYDLAGDYQEIILKTGVNSTVTKRSLEGKENYIVDHWATSSCDGYVVTRSNTRSMIDCDKVKPGVTYYLGNVYCATISGGVLFTRRNGKAMWSGNSAVPDKIWEVSEGGTTDGEPMWFVFGNPTRNTGRFYQSMFGSQRHRWQGACIDSRSVKITNKERIQEWVDDYGEDSDFVRVRVRGLPPSRSVTQFVDKNTLYAAKDREPEEDPGAPVILGVDVARFGDDHSVIITRVGRDAKSIPYKRYTHQDTQQLGHRVVEHVEWLTEQGYGCDIINIDGGGVGGGVVDFLKSLGYNVNEVNFGGKAQDSKKYANKGSEMWGRMRDWLENASIPSDIELEQELMGREYGFAKDGQLMLEKKSDMKKRGLPSPDIADALSLTFAENVLRRDMPQSRKRMNRRQVAQWEYDVFDEYPQNYH